MTISTLSTPEIEKTLIAYQKHAEWLGQRWNADQEHMLIALTRVNKSITRLNKELASR